MIPSTRPLKPQHPQGDSDKGKANEPAKVQPGADSANPGDSRKSIKDYLREADIQRDA